MIRPLDTRQHGLSALQHLRGRIDQIDREILVLLNQRMRQAQHIGALKRKHNLPINVPARENQLLQRLLRNNPGPLTPAQLLRSFRTIIGLSKQQEQVRSIFLDLQDPYLVDLCAHYFGPQIVYHPLENINHIPAYLQEHPGGLALVPMHTPHPPYVVSSLQKIGWESCRLIDELHLERSLPASPRQRWTYGVLASQVIGEVPANRAYCICESNPHALQEVRKMSRQFGLGLRYWKLTDHQNVLLRLTDERNQLGGMDIWQQLSLCVGSLKRLGIYATRQLVWRFQHDL